jgi:hypothetical protein
MFEPLIFVAAYPVPPIATTSAVMETASEGLGRRRVMPAMVSPARARNDGSNPPDRGGEPT